jgi:2-oxoacid:acceptor oxidoreductase gamma subunit (pyruvate/2-ketoisovalerate family)
MIEIEFLGSGGQGVVMASEILARACFEEGLYPQCFSVFGGERRGAPVVAFIRVNHRKVYLKCDIEQPDHLVLFDGSLWNGKEVVPQISPGGLLLLNQRGKASCNPPKGCRIGWIDALEISKKNGLRGNVNTTILGAYVRFSQIVKLETLLQAIRVSILPSVQQNISAAKEAYYTLSMA